MTRTAATTTTALLDWLREHDFTPSEDGDWFDHGNVRVAFDDTDVMVYTFERHGVLVWKARLSNAPDVAVVATIEAALTDA